jgi:hypothetical protein
VVTGSGGLMVGFAVVSRTVVVVVGWTVMLW